MKRKYDIGHGVTIADDGYTFLAGWREGANTCHSIGIKRPRLGPTPEMLKVTYSLGQKFFYLSEFADTQGFWLGMRKWESKENMEAQQSAGIYGKESVKMTRTDTGEEYYREMLSFLSWDVKAEREEQLLPLSDEAVKDYLTIVQQKDRDDEKRFNDAIAFTGRTLKWISEKIGVWVPEPDEPPPIVLD